MNEDLITFVDKLELVNNDLDAICKIFMDNQDWLIKFYQSIKPDIRFNKDSYLKREKHFKEFQASHSISDAILYLHYLVYDILYSSHAYDRTDSKSEMSGLNKEINYIINVYSKVENYPQFFMFITTFALESKFNSHLYIGYDLEYTMNIVQLYQLNYEHSHDHRSFIFIVSPSIMPVMIHDTFVNLNILNPKITKILHGSDSKDLPYIYEQMLHNDNDKIIVFTKSMIETRWLCEYYKLNHGDSNDNKCDIYHAVWYFKLISTEKYDELQQIILSMGSPSDIVWNIIWLDKTKTRYAYYDVIFLKYFYYQMIKMGVKEAKNKSEKNKLLQFYHDFMYQLTQFVYLEKKGITTLSERCKLEGDPMNNYMIRERNGGIHRLNDIFKEISTNIVTDSPYVDLDKLFKINYFRKNLTYILKKICYTILSKRFSIKKDKDTFFNDRLSNDFVFDVLKEMKFPLLEQFFRKTESIMLDRINQKIK